MNESTLFKSYVLTAGQETEVNASGKFMYVEQCDGDVSISLDDGSPFKIRSGFEFVNRDFNKFRLISNVGAGGASVTVRIYAGHIYVSNRNPVVFTAPVPNYIVPRTALLLNTTTFAILATNTRTGQSFSDAQIYQHVFALTAVSYFEVYDTASGTLCGRVPSSDDRKFELTTGITLKAIGDCTYAIMSAYKLPV